MRINKYHESVVSKDDLIRLILNGYCINNVTVDNKAEIDTFNEHSAQILNDNMRLSTETTDGTVESYHLMKSNIWLMPDYYKNINVLSYLLNRCSNQIEIDRVDLEYDMYKDRNMITVLQFFIFLVDHFREQNIVWGIGRGSSVSSFILFLIGMHKIDSIMYDLSIHEFLR